MKSGKTASAAGIIAGLAMLGASPAAAQETETRSVIASYFQRGDCLDMAPPENVARIFTCRDSQSHGFSFVSGNEGMITLGEGQCLTATKLGEPLIARTCENTPNQQWRFAVDGTLRNTLDQCADIERVDPNIGARVIAWTCHAQINQQWYPGVAVAAVDLAPGGKQLPASGADIYVGSRGFSLDNVVAAGGATVVPDGAGRLVGAHGAFLVRGGTADMFQNADEMIVFTNIRKTSSSAGNPLSRFWAFFSGTARTG